MRDWLSFAVLLAAANVGLGANDGPLEYNRDVRPILADRCFTCHGPDASARKAELRLDVRADAVLDRDGEQVLSPGRPQDSLLMSRIESHDDENRMPPVDSGAPRLTEAETELLRRWIAEGAAYQTHWAFLPPRSAAPPSIKDRAWPRNPIDRFVLAKLERVGMSPAQEADAASLIRRVTFDLTGLPPSLPELDAFAEAAKADLDMAYEALVDRLLASPRYGERQANRWLDAARYADTNGYFTDNERTMWLWRDGVIDAFNQNKPYDQFTMEQLAGDMIPGASLQQKIASGFNRNHMVNNETGIVEEEFRIEYVSDRVDTTATVWLGLTLACARCHDHKFDPISQRDFYRFFALFNNLPERGLSGSQGNAAPLLNAPTELQTRELREIQSAIRNARSRLSVESEELASDQQAWESRTRETITPLQADDAVLRFELDSFDAARGDMLKVGNVKSTAGMFGRAAEFIGDGCLQVSTNTPFQRQSPFSVAAWIRPASAGCVISQMDDANQMRGFDVTLRKGKAVVNLVHQWNRNAIRVVTANSVPSRQWQHLIVTYDGSSRASGLQIYLDGKLQPLRISQDTLTGIISNAEPIRLGRRQGSASLKGAIDELRIYDRALTEKEAAGLATGQLVRGILARSNKQRSPSQAAKLRDWYVRRHASEEFLKASRKLDELVKQERRLKSNMPTAMVMSESTKPRATFMLERGQYDLPGEQVHPGVPAFLGVKKDIGRANASLSSPQSPPITNRLQLARWLTDPRHPLTSRVSVNRIWAELFGVGIVRTVDDFGTQGEWPSHPQLLDWLAIEFVEQGWDLKRLLRLIVTSSTYRQSSKASRSLYERDPSNRLLARGGRIRLDAESVRDNALALSGLLVERLGGSSVKPFQPEGLWRDVTYDADLEYQQDEGGAAYRRSLYTYWKRQAPPPNMLVFDAPTRETCTIQRSRTNTPLQALTLMNDSTFVEAARTLAERVLNDPTRSDDNGLRRLFRIATSRSANSRELRILQSILRQQRQAFTMAPSDAARLIGERGSAYKPMVDSVELGAWTIVASTILCLDETITRP